MIHRMDFLESVRYLSLEHFASRQEGIKHAVTCRKLWLAHDNGVPWKTIGRK